MKHMIIPDTQVKPDSDYSHMSVGWSLRSREEA
jgi:hypothetical protein